MHKITLLNVVLIECIIGVQVFSNFESLMFFTRNKITQILSCTLKRSAVKLSFMCCPQTHKELLVLVSPSDQFRE